MSMALQSPPQITSARVAAARWPLQHFVDWLWFEGLPLWASEREGGFLPFAERRDSTGRRNDPGYVRLRVMARQTAVYAQAARAVWHEGKGVASLGWHALQSLYWREDHGWSSRVDFYGRTIDDRFDLYDQAFALYACAHWARVSGSQVPLALASRTLALIDRKLKSDRQPGWRSSDRAHGYDQNSHMHFLEALLALHETGGVSGVEARIEAVLRLAERKLYDPASGTIAEHFDAQWMPPVSGATVEPGHLLEWCWLIATARQLGFQTDLPTGRFAAFARRYGVSRTTGLLYDRCTPQGQPIGPNHRLWPHCEALRAAASRASDDAAELEAQAIAQRLLKRFLSGPVPGCWIERLSGNLQPKRGHVPATSLYHLWEAAQAVVGAGWAQWPGRLSC